MVRNENSRWWISHCFGHRWVGLFPLGFSFFMLYFILSFLCTFKRNAHEIHLCAFLEMLKSICTNQFLAATFIMYNPDAFLVFHLLVPFYFSDSITDTRLTKISLKTCTQQYLKMPIRSTTLLLHGEHRLIVFIYFFHNLQPLLWT